MCNDYGADFLGALPLNLSIRQQADAGRPTVVADPGFSTDRKTLLAASTFQFSLQRLSSTAVNKKNSALQYPPFVLCAMV